MTTRILKGALVSAVAALGLGLTGAQAQPYDDAPPTTYMTARGVTVYVHPYYRERGPSGAPIVTLQASRVVPIADLDLGTGYGRHIMRERVRRAAVDVCRELDMMPGYLPAVGENDVDCYHRAVDDALANAPVAVDSDYYGR